MRRWQAAVVFVFLAGLTRPMWAASQQPLQNPNQISFEDSLLRGFTVTLALGEIEGGRSNGTFTPAATKALADLKDFLPYKSYRPLDTVWMLGLNGPHQFLLGQDGQKHEFYMRSTLISPLAIKVDLLRLWDVAPSGPRPPGPPLAALIDTSFNLKVGETVAVGTSRIDSNRGLILLVTAAPK